MHDDHVPISLPIVVPSESIDDQHRSANDLFVLIINPTHVVDPIQLTTSS